MSVAGKKLGILLSTDRNHPKFQHGLALASSALDQGVNVFLYCIDDAVEALAVEALLSLQAKGLKIFACAYSAQKRNLPLTAPVTYSGLATLSDIISATDRFVGF